MRRNKEVQRDKTDLWIKNLESLLPKKVIEEARESVTSKPSKLREYKFFYYRRLMDAYSARYTD